MTRINLVPTAELHDQHLFAEWREIKMVPRSLERSIAARGVQGALSLVRPEFVLGPGHVSFFYDKGAYLQDRYFKLTKALLDRGIDCDIGARFDPHGTIRQPAFYGWYTPTPEALALVRARIAERVAMRPGWYRHSGLK